MGRLPQVAQYGGITSESRGRRVAPDMASIFNRPYHFFQPLEPPPAKKSKNLYDSFVHARDREERGLAAPGSGSLLGGGGEGGGSGGKGHTKGNTIYVFGYQITEELLKNTFAACGKIVNISMEVEKVIKR